MKIRSYAWVTLTTLLLGGTARAESLTPKSAEADVLAEIRHPDLEQMFSDGQVDEGLKLARARLAASPDDAELYVHVFRFLFEKGERTSRDQDAKAKEKLYLEMLDLMERGLKVAPGHPRLLWGQGIALARLGTTRGVLESLGNAKRIRSSWEAVIEKDYRYRSPGGEEVLPCDTYLALGIMYRLVPDYWIVGALSGMRGNLEKSLDYAERSDRCEPGRIRAEKELGAIRLCIAETRGDPAMKKKGEAALKALLKREARREIDRIDQRHARMLLDDPSLACGYSRDGQQERDAAKADAKK